MCILDLFFWGGKPFDFDIVENNMYIKTFSIEGWYIHVVWSSNTDCKI